MPAPRYIPDQGTGGGGPVGPPAGPTGTWAEDAAVDDALTVRTLVDEDATVDDALAVKTTMGDDASVQDAFSMALALAEDASIDDALTVATVLGDDATVDDALAAKVTVADDATVGDEWTAELNAAWAEDATVADTLGIRTLLGDDATVDDLLAVKATLAEDATLADDLRVLVALTEDSNVNDLLRLELVDIDAARSATPDADLLTDGWTDQASTGTNNGNSSLLVKGKSTLANDERRGHFLVDLRSFATWTAGGSGLTVTVRASTDGLTATTLTWSAQAFASGARPFTESTLTWANQPATGTGAGTGTISVATGAAATYSFTITPANLAAALGGWLLVTYTAATAAAPSTVTVISRDSATAGDRPKVTISHVQRGT